MIKIKDIIKTDRTGTLLLQSVSTKCSMEELQLITAL